MVFRYVLYRLGDRRLAEDLTSETFLRALRRIGSVNYQGSDIGAWFITIARNLVIDYVKRRRSREVVTDRVGDFLPLVEDPDVIVPRQRGAEDAAERLRQLVEVLSDVQRAVIRARFFDGLTIIETMAVLGFTEGVVKSAQFRGLAGVRRRSGVNSVVEFIDTAPAPRKASA